MFVQSANQASDNLIDEACIRLDLDGQAERGQ